MPIDPNIILNVRPPQRENPFTMLSELVNAQTAIGQLHAQRQQQADQAAMRQVLTETGGNLEEAFPRLRQIAPGAALDLETKWGAQRKSQFDALRSQVELDSKQLDLGLRYLQSVRTPQSFAAAKRAIQAIDPDVAAMLGDTYDPDRVDQMLNVGLTAKEFLDRRKESLELFTKGDLTKAVGGWLSTATSDQEWNTVLKTAADFGAPPQLLQQFGTFSPDNVKRAGLLTMTPKEREAPPTGVPNIGSFEDYVLRDAAQTGRDPKTYTTADIDKLRETYRLDPRITVNANTQRPITQTAEANLITRLNSQWTTATKPGRELKSQLETMRRGLAAAERGDLPQGTEAVLQPFLKILDPNSVVREGEFWRLREGMSLLSRAQTVMQRLTSGGFVPLSELKKYAQLAEEIATRQDSYVKGVRTRIGTVADRYNIPHELVFETEAPPTDDRSTTAPPPPATSGPKVGEKRMINGQLAEWKTINGQSGWVAVR
jgi:hypothetical protein